MNHNVCGRMKEGKTSLARWLALRSHKASVAWDPRCMIDGVVCYGPDDLEEAINSGAWRQDILVYRFDNEDVEEEFSQLCEILFPPRFTLGNFSLVIDEAAQLQKSNSIHPKLDRAIRQHPRSVEIFQTSHSLQDWSRSGKDLVSDIYCFNMTGRSLDAAVDFMDGDERMREIIQNLPPHTCIHWLHATHKYRIVEPKEWSQLPYPCLCPEHQIHWSGNENEERMVQ